MNLQAGVKSSLLKNIGLYFAPVILMTLFIGQNMYKRVILVCTVKESAPTFFHSDYMTFPSPIDIKDLQFIFNSVDVSADDVSIETKDLQLQFSTS